MKFSIQRNSLLNGLTHALGAVTSKSSLPALEGLLITADTQLTITGYDLEIGIVVTLEASVEEKGSIVLNAQTFSEIIKKLPDDVVNVTIKDDLKTDIVCGMSKFFISGISPDEFPELPRIEYNKSLSLPENLLRSMIKQTVYAVSINENKPVHTGCLFNIEGNVINSVGVDGYRLALRQESIDLPPDQKFSFIVPGKSLTKLLRMIDDTETLVNINIAEKHAIFEIENIVLMTRLLEGDFLNYKNAIPKEMPIHIIADVKTFVDSIDRASLLISERQRSPIRLKFEKDDVVLLCVSPLGRVEDKFSVQSNGGEVEIGFNNKYLSEAFRNTECDEVEIGLKDSLSPMVIKPVNSSSFTFLVLPVRLKNE
ncbi:MAG: DNA polymerase III subunit beta [Bacillota bacterium]|nr:DNA polymerase III subunit beta [Bacillota bacterium]